MEYLQILDEKGKPDKKLEPKYPDEKLKRMYELMVLTRAFDTKAVNLQRQGRMGTYAPVLGQEAVGVGAALALRDEDWTIPTYREPQVYYIKGVPMEMLYMYWRGSEDGMNFPEGANVFPFAVPIGTHLPHAAGIGLALKRAKKKQVVMAFIGDGGTSEGDFHEALNFAGVWKIPLVVIIVNNGWAISLPRNEQSASKTLAQKGLAYGIPGIQVDGNDVLAVHKAVGDAVENARKGYGPRIVEAVTFRMSMHTTADDPTKYRSEKEVDEWGKRDPIERFRAYLKSKKLWDKAYEDDLQEKSKAQVDKAVEIAESWKADPHDMFRFVWAEMTDDLKQQMEEMERYHGLEAMR